MTQQPQPPRTPPASAAPRHGQPTIGELLGRISENISGLIRGEIELTKAKALRVASTAGAGAALLGAAAVAALFGLGFLLAAVVAPEALKSTARRTVQGTAAEWRRRARIRAARLKTRAGPARDDPLVREAPADPGSCPMGCACLRTATARLSPASVRDRLLRLVDDARDGEPASLAIVTGAVVVLAGVSVVAVVKAVRR